MEFNLYLQEIIFVTDDAVLTIETTKLVFNPWRISFDDFEIREEGTSAKKVTLMDEKEDVDKVCSEVRKSSDDAGGKLTRGFLLQHKNI